MAGLETNLHDPNVLVTPSSLMLGMLLADLPGLSLNGGSSYELDSKKRKKESEREIDLEGLVGQDKNLSLDPAGNAKLLKHSKSLSGLNFRKTYVGLSRKNIKFCDKNRLYTLKDY